MGRIRIDPEEVAAACVAAIQREDIEGAVAVTAAMATRPGVAERPFREQG